MKGIFLHVKADPKEMGSASIYTGKIIKPQNIGAKYTYTNDELLDALVWFYKKHGRPPTVRELGRKNGLPSPWMYSQRFGGLVQAFRLAGIPVKRFTIEEIYGETPRKQNKA